MGEKASKPKVRIIREGSPTDRRYLSVSVDGISDVMIMDPGDVLVLEWKITGDRLTLKFTKGDM